MLDNGNISRNTSGLNLRIEFKQELIDFTKKYLNKHNVKFLEDETCGYLSIKWSNSDNIKLNISIENLYNNDINNDQTNNEKQIHSSLLH